jgi:glycosyltransferase involved in cell wall biosynthesis
MVEQVIQSGTNGLLAQSDDDWYEALDALVANPALRARIGSAGRDVVVSEYSLERWAPRLLEVLQTAVESRRVLGEEHEAPATAGATEHL